MQTTLLATVVCEAEGCIYTSLKDKHEHFIERFCQRNRSTGRKKSQIISEGQVFSDFSRNISTEPPHKLAIHL